MSLYSRIIIELPEADRDRSYAILAWADRARAAERGLADKDRKLLEQLDDPALVHPLLTLPSRLIAAARQSTPFASP